MLGYWLTAGHLNRQMVRGEECGDVVLGAEFDPEPLTSGLEIGRGHQDTRASAKPQPVARMRGQLVGEDVPPAPQSWAVFRTRTVRRRSCATCLKILEPLGVIDLVPAVLTLPLVTRLLADRQPLAHCGDRKALAQLHVRLSQLVQRFFRCVTLSCHDPDLPDPRRSLKLRVGRVEGKDHEQPERPGVRCNQGLGMPGRIEH